MNPRMAKEARQMFWPWALVTGAAALALVMPWDWQPAWTFPHLTEVTFVLVLFIGFPLLAGLPIGYEFQFGTLPALLASPVERGRIWRDKILLTLAVLLSPAILCALRARANHIDIGFGFFVGAWIAALAAAAVFWTLFAKSTMGGLALNVGTQWLLFAGWSYLEGRLRLYGQFAKSIEVAAALLFFSYAGVMVWLGRRALLRFQAIEGSSAGDPLSAISARLVPARVAEWFQCRPEGLVSNLIRKELRLLRPVWPLAALNVLAWTCLLALGTDPGYDPGLRNPAGALILAALVATVALSPTIAILAGTLSLGEEKTFGTHSWHMTLPASLRLQWSVKLAVALLAGALFVGALPPLAFAVRGLILHAPFRTTGTNVLWIWPLVFAGLTLAAFWLSTLVKGTVRAALAVFPALILLWMTGYLSFWSGDKFAAWAQSLSDHLLYALDTFRVAKITISAAWGFPVVLVALGAAAVPVVAFITFQCYRKFRSQQEDTNRRLAGNLLLAAAVVFACGAMLGDLAGLARRSIEQERMLFWDTGRAIERLEAATPAQLGAQPLHLTAAELGRAFPLSKTTRHWLDGVTVTAGVQRRKPPFECCPVFDFFHDPTNQPLLRFTAMISLTNGSRCKMDFEGLGRPNQGYAVVGGRCE